MRGYSELRLYSDAHGAERPFTIGQNFAPIAGATTERRGTMAEENNTNSVTGLIVKMLAVVESSEQFECGFVQSEPSHEDGHKITIYVYPKGGEWRKSNEVPDSNLRQRRKNRGVH